MARRRRHRLRRALSRALARAGLALAVLLPVAAPAAVFPGVRIEVPGEAPLELDVHTPAAPGPHPVLLARAAEGAGSAFARRFAQRGHVVAVLPAASTPAALRAAVLWFARQGAAYGGDPRRLRVAGYGAMADDLPLLLEASEPLLREALDGIALLGPLRITAARVAQRPELLSPSVFVVLGPSARAERLREIEALRVQGVRVTRAEAEADGEALARGAGAPGEVGADLLEGWLASLAVARVQRLEHLSYERGPLLPGARALGAAPGRLLVAVDDALGARIDGSDDGTRFSPELVVAGARHLALASRADGSVDWLLESAGALEARRRVATEWQSVPTPEGPRGPFRAWVDEEGFLVVDGRGVAWRLARSATSWQALEQHRVGAAPSALARVDRTLYGAVAGGVFALERLPPDAAANDPGVVALAAVHDPAPGGRSHLLAAFAHGALVRFDPVLGVTTQELDLAEAHAALWPQAEAVRPASPILALHHPHRGERLEWIPLQGAKLGASAVWRHRTRYADAPRPAPEGFDRWVDAVASPLVGEVGRGFRLLARTSDTISLWSARLSGPTWPRGLWRDPARPGRGLALEAMGDGEWLALWLDLGDDGRSRWRRAEWAGGLDRGEVELLGPDGSAGARLAFEFGSDPRRAPCAGILAPASAPRLRVTITEGDGRALETCLSPPLDAGVPEANVDGLWSHGEGTDWLLQVRSSGADRAARQQVLLAYVDQQGAARWLIGDGVAGRSGSDVGLTGFESCAGCASTRAVLAGAVSLRFRGPCGEVEGTASLLAPRSARGDALLVDGARLVPLAAARCY